MAVRKLSLSLTPELAEALDRLCAARDEDRSRLVETLLREHPLIHQAVLEDRGTAPAAPSTRWEVVGRRKRLRLD